MNTHALTHHAHPAGGSFVARHAPAPVEVAVG